MRCTCFLGLPDVSTARHAEATTPSLCPVHGQRTQDTTTGALGGAPVVALGLTIDGLFQHAEQCRRNRETILRNADQIASALAAEADYLESLAATLAGATTPRSTT